ncbi:hypothetical protein [Hymenobacter persicinus]|uniref:DoxX family membrane protein n=1 Tax=Hymenobacter persicinus TaxID=2025506 RepID=A0A4Q5LFQ3_9BACT|nr:hypothetical protein [Hymenobacter persicinus]RYU81844.1 hypothetical protein EWM57_05540 [Hymenobacter persicinus]
MSLLAWKQKVWLQLAVIYTRYLIGGAFVFASLIKLKGRRFTTLSGESAPIHSAAHFFETLYQAGPYWKFIGLGQLVAGLLLMTQRYALVGALLFLPIIANVYVITYSYDFGATTWTTGLMLLATVGLLAWDWNILRALVHQPVLPAPTSALYERRLWEAVGGVLFLYTAIYRALVDQYNALQWFAICGLVGLLGLVIAAVLHRRERRALPS